MIRVYFGKIMESLLKVRSLFSVAARLNAVQERQERGTFETQEDMKEQVSKSNSKWMELFKARDYAGISKLYTVDCKMLVSGCELMIGREGMTHDSFNHFFLD